MKKIFLHLSICVLVLAVLGQQARADEVLTAVDEAVKQYEKGDYDGSASNLDYAAQLIRQKKSEALKEVLPEPFAGWEAEPATAQATGTAVFGKNVSVSRTYARKPSAVTIDIVSDSPVMQSLIMMLSNPVLAGAGGAKVETFAAHKGIVKYDEVSRNGDVNIVIDNKFLVTVTGQQVDREELIAYAQAVQFSKLTNK